MSSSAPTTVTAISMRAERNQPNANARRPSFISNPNLFDASPNAWFRVVLPLISTYTFVIEDLPALEFFRNMMLAPNLAQIWRFITKVDLSGLHWFSGIAHNRTSNPYLELVGRLPKLQELTLKFHTAGLTTSRWGERERIRLESVDMERSKELVVLRMEQVVTRWDLTTVFSCSSLRILHLECIQSDMVRYFAKTGNPLSPFYDLRDWFRQGFLNQHQTVHVDTRTLPIQ